MLLVCGVYCNSTHGLVQCLPYKWFYRGPCYLMVVSFGSSPTPPPSPVSNLSLFLSLPACHQSSSISRGAEPIRPGESLTLYKSFNTLWYEWKSSLISGLIPRISQLKTGLTFSRKCTNFPNFPAALQKTMNVHICTILRKIFDCLISFHVTFAINGVLSAARIG